MFTKNVVVILIAGALSTLSAGAVERGGYGVGNGGDGLELANASAAKDVVVPIPGEVGDTGVLEVVGIPGNGQDDFFRIVFCETDAEGKLKKGGCKSGKDIVGTLNVSMNVIPGTYFVTYEYHHSILQVRANQKTVVELQKLQVPPSSRQIKAEVTSDYTSSPMQEQLLQGQFAWFDTGLLEYFCGGARYSRNKEACVGYLSDDYRKLRDSAVRFQADGDVRVWDFVGQQGWGDLSVSGASAKPGDFVSVLPGVYAITFTDTQTGQSKTVRGIDVR